MRAGRSFVLVMIVTVMSMALAACGSAGAAFPTGHFASEKDAANGWDFNPDGTWAAYLASAEPFARGTYSVDGNVYTETSNDIGDPDPACQGVGKYKWSFDGSKLTLELLEDTCAARARAYPGVWVLQNDKSY